MLKAAASLISALVKDANYTPKLGHDTMGMWACGVNVDVCKCPVFILRNRYRKQIIAPIVDPTIAAWLEARPGSLRPVQPQP